MLPDSVRRSLQSFSSGTQWVDTVNLDSAAATWAGPVPEEYEAGDVAYEDDAFGGASPTFVGYMAYVAASPGESGTSINLILVDDSDDVVYSATFDSGGVDPPDCKSPSVEVIYSHDEQTAYGLLTVHVVWSELTEGLFYDDWELYYAVAVWPFFDGTVIDGDDDPVYTDLDPVLASPSTAYDELQPDLAIVPNGDLLLVYSQYDFGEVYGDIMKIHGDDAYFNGADWGTPYVISDPDTDDQHKGGPSVDVGTLDSLNPSTISTEVEGVVVWSEHLSNYQDEWVVMYNRFLPEQTSGFDANLQQITGSTPDRPRALPVVDIPAPSCISTEHSARQAVIAYTIFTVDEGEYTVPIVKVAITPNLDETDHFAVDTYSLSADLACYQMNDGDNDEMWFGISYYQTDDTGPPFDFVTKTMSFSFNVEWGTGDLTGSQEYDEPVPSSSGYWDPDNNPLTASTLVLRDPYIADAGGEPKNDIFGIGWIEDVSSTLYGYRSSGWID